MTLDPEKDLIMPKSDLAGKQQGLEQKSREHPEFKLDQEEETEKVTLPTSVLDSLMTLTRSLGDKVKAYASGLKEIGEALDIPSSDSAPPEIGVILENIENIKFFFLESYCRKVAIVLAKAHPKEDFSEFTPSRLLEILEKDYEAKNVNFKDK